MSRKKKIKLWDYPKVGLTVEQRKKNCMRKGVLCGHRRPLGSNNAYSSCMYILDTGERRGCDEGKNCKRYTDEACFEIADEFYIS